MPAPRNPVTVVMADDDPDDRELTREAFAQAGLAADLRFVEDGEELLDYLHRKDAERYKALIEKLGLRR